MIEIVSIGNELLSGATINTNAAFLSRELSLHGWKVARQTVLPDDPLPLRAGLQEAIKRSPIVIATGGLGPTLDDHTRKVAAAIFDSGFHFDEKLAADLKRRYGKHLLSLDDQARVPDKAELLHNPIGTAPGFVFTKEDGFLILMPGVPVELEAMCQNELLPFLEKRAPKQDRKHVERVHLCLVTESEVDPFLRELKKNAPNVEIGIYPHHSTLSVSFSGIESKEVQKLAQQLKTEFLTHVFPSSSGKIEEALHALLVSKNRKLALAESCTGGKIAAHLTALPGASDYFLGSFVVYSNELKESLLAVSRKILEERGAVGPETVEAMLSGLFKATTADYGIAVSGVAGPSGGTEEKPVGTIWAAVGERGKTPFLFTFHARGDRAKVLLTTTNRVLATLWRRISFGV